MGKMRRLVAALVVAVSAVACSSGDVAPTPIPTQPGSFAPPTVVETFAGTLTILGTDSHPFNVPVPGEVDITLTKIAPATDTSTPPAENTTLMLAIGLPSTTTIGQCATLQTVSATAASSPQIKGHALTGNFCVSVTDPGNLTDSISYSLTVAHP
jgi:hypothetical protein